jgi:hypothetical protein
MTVRYNFCRSSPWTNHSPWGCIVFFDLKPLMLIQVNIVEHCFFVRFWVGKSIIPGREESRCLARWPRINPDGSGIWSQPFPGLVRGDCPMTNFDLAMRRIEQGHRVRFYQDFYGRQWMKVSGGAMFWRTRQISLRNEEVVSLKNAIARRRLNSSSTPGGDAQAADAA